MFRKSYFFLLPAVVFILLSDLAIIKYKVLYGGDEIIAYLCATGNAGNYEEVLHQHYPYGEMADAAAFKHYFETGAENFKHIAPDLCANDLHPPLYFWLLHFFVRMLGVHVYTGIVLNLLFQLCTLALIYRLALFLLQNSTHAAFAALVWSVNPACAIVEQHARPYELVALVSVFYLWNFWAWMRNPRKLNAMMLVVGGAAGLLTHYSFIYLIASCGLLLLIRWHKPGWRQVTAFAAAAAVAFVLMTLVQPCYADSFALQQARKQPFSFHDIPFRLGKTAISLADFFIPGLALKSFSLHLPLWMIIAFFTCVAAALFFLYRFRKDLPDIVKHMKVLKNDDAFVLLILLTGLIVVPYLLFITPVHAMSARYLVYLYPLMAIATTRLFYSGPPPRLRTFLLAGLVSGSLLVTAGMIWNNYFFESGLIKMVQQNQIIVANDLDRRAFPRLIPYLHEGQKILLDERAVYENDSLMQELLKQKPFLMIYGNRDRRAGIKYGAKCHVLFKTGDGVNFFVKEFR